MNFDQVLQEARTRLLSLAPELLYEFEKKENYPLKIFQKNDGSCLTHLDLLLDEKITQALGFSGYPLVSEEQPFPPLSNNDHFWLLDPLDGTKELVDQTNDYCINLSFISKNHPIFGWILYPKKKLLYQTNQGRVELWDLTKKVSTVLKAPHYNPNSIFGVSKRQYEDIKDHIVHQFKLIGAGVKFLALVHGDITLYPRIGPSGEWDTAAGQAIIESLGGFVVDLAGERLAYQKDNFINSGFYAGFDKCKVDDFKKTFKNLLESF